MNRYHAHSQERGVPDYPKAQSRGGGKDSVRFFRYRDRSIAQWGADFGFKSLLQAISSRVRQSLCRRGGMGFFGLGPNASYFGLDLSLRIRVRVACLLPRLQSFSKLADQMTFSYAPQSISLCLLLQIDMAKAADKIVEPPDLPRTCNGLLKVACKGNPKWVPAWQALL